MVPISMPEVHFKDIMSGNSRFKFQVIPSNRSPKIMRARSKNEVLRKTALK